MSTDQENTQAPEEQEGEQSQDTETGNKAEEAQGE